MHGDYQFANVMYRHGAPHNWRAIVDWEMGTVGDPNSTWAGWCELADETPTAARQDADASGDELRRHARHASRDQVVEHYAKVSAVRSTTWTTTWCWPSGSWRSCWSRASSGGR
jgi:aminoglycoside phosphotransferase (APT) family kinase protein